jgi:hypothetical protein
MLCRGVSAAKRASSAVVASSRCMASAAGLRQTLVHDEHVEAGATMVSVIEWLVCVLHLCSHCNGADRVQLRAPALLQWHCRVHVCTTHRPHCTHYSRSNLSARTVACCFLVAKLNPLLSKSSRLCTAQHFSCAAPTAVNLPRSLAHPVIVHANPLAHSHVIACMSTHKIARSPALTHANSLNSLAR